MTTPEDVRTAWDVATITGKAYTDAVLAFQRALDEYRKAHPVPPGKYWAFVHGEMVLSEASAECTYDYGDGIMCEAEPVVAWDDAGNAWCEEHRPKEP